MLFVVEEFCKQSKAIMMSVDRERGMGLDAEAENQKSIHWACLADH